MSLFDSLFERSARGVARRMSRRSSLAQLGQILVGAALVPVLPVSRVSHAQDDPGDPTQCDYWRYCGFDGFVCACCGGTVSQCPPGTSVSSGSVAPAAASTPPLAWRSWTRAIQ